MLISGRAKPNVLGCSASVMIWLICYPGFAQFDEFVNYIPDDANALVVVRAGKIMQTYRRANDSGQPQDANQMLLPEVAIPPETERIMVASHCDIELMSPSWEIAIIELATRPSADDVAKSVGGVRDEIAGRECFFAEGKYVIQFEPNRFGVISPADRQKAGRWIREIESGRTGIQSTYLLDAVKSMNSKVDALLAMDLVDVLSPQGIQSGVERSKTLRDADADEAAIVSLFSGIQGVKLEIGVREGTVLGKLTVRFHDDPKILKGFAKELFLETLSNAGAKLPDFDDWNESLTNDEVSLSGRMTPQSMRTALSLLTIRTDAVKEQNAPTETLPPESDDAPVADDQNRKRKTIGRASARYYRNVARIAEDALNDNHASSWNEYTMWIDAAARRVDTQSTLNVDPEIAKLGAAISSGLQQIVAGYHDASNQAALQKSTVLPKVETTYGVAPIPHYGRYAVPYGGSVTPYGGYGRRYYGHRYAGVRFGPTAYTSVDVNSAISERRKITVQEWNRAQDHAKQISQEVHQTLQMMQRILQEQYGDAE